MSKNIICSIAGIPFSLSCDSDEPIQGLKKAYTGFISKSRPVLDFQLQYKRNIPRISQFPEVKWEKDSFEIRINGSHINGNIPTGRIEVQTSYKWAVGDLLRSFFSIYLVKMGGFLLHASCIIHRGGAYIFCGPTETGKTTIARLAERRTVLTDESVAVLKRSYVFQAFATPFFGEFGMINKNRSGKIKALFFIEKSNSFSHEKVASFDAHLGLFKNIVLSGRSNQMAEDLFNTFSEFTDEVPCLKLYFKQSPLLWRYLDERIAPILS